MGVFSIMHNLISQWLVYLFVFISINLTDLNFLCQMSSRYIYFLSFKYAKMKRELVVGRYLQFFSYWHGQIISYSVWLTSAKSWTVILTAAGLLF